MSERVGTTRRTRNASFSNSQWAPTGPTLTLRNSSVRGPFSFMNPTTALYDIKSNTSQGGDPRVTEELTDAEKQERAQVRWNARDYRKGRHVLILPRNSPLAAKIHGSSHPNQVLVGIGRMFTLFPYWDVSWLVGISFTFGCLIFIACGLFYWLALAAPSMEFSGQDSIAGGVSAFVGATLFQIGAILLFLESYNDRAETQFGGAMEHLFVDRLKIARRSQHHRPRHYEVDRDAEQPVLGGSDHGPKQSPPRSEENNPMHHTPSQGSDDPKHLAPLKEIDEEAAIDTFTERAWQWYPSWHDVTTHYVYEIGFLASLTMSVGATIFYVTGILALPGIYDHLSDGVIDGVYYLTYLVGGVFFSVSSLLYILETQPNWHTPQPFKIGWHVGAWNLVGSLGWTIAASLGYCKADMCSYQSELTLVWASAAFSLGSALQWYESLDKYVVIMED